MQRLFRVLLFVALSGLPAGLEAQTNLDTLISAPQGTPQIPVRYGYVNLNTGNLHLEIPLVSMGERAGGPSTMTLTYDSMFLQGGAPTGPVMRQVIKSGFQQMGSVYPINVQTQACASSNGISGSIETYNTWEMVDANGTYHLFSPGTTNTQNCTYVNTIKPVYPNGYGSLTAAGQATDGSGFFISITNGNTPQLFAPDGANFAGSANGNEGFLNSNMQGPAPQGGPGLGTDALPGMSSGCFQSVTPAQPYVAKAPQTCSLTYRPFNGSPGATIAYTLVYEYIPICTAFNAALDATHQAYDYCGGIWAVESLTMPDGASVYSFSYDTGTTSGHYGQLTSMALPTGGTISYSYYAPTGTGTTYSSTMRQDIKSITDNGGTTSFARTWCTYGLSCLIPFQTATITYPSHVPNPAVPGNVAQDQTVYTMTQSPTTGNVAPTAVTEQISLGGVLTQTKTWDTTVIGIPAYAQTTWNQTGATDSVEYTYTTGDVVQRADEYVNGALYRSVVKQYQQDTSSIPYVSQFHMVDYPIQTQILDGGGSLVAQENRTYDEYGASYCNVAPPGVGSIPMLTVVNGAIGHDDVNFGSGRWARGNPTTITSYTSAGATITKHYCYDTLGNVTESIDGNGNPTSYSYVDNYADTNCVLASTPTYAYPTVVTDALGHKTKTAYSSCLKQPRMPMT